MAAILKHQGLAQPEPSDGPRSLWCRIGQAWQVLRGKNDLVDLFDLGMDAGKYTAFQIYQRTGVVLDPFADEAEATIPAQRTGGAR